MPSSTDVARAPPRVSRRRIPANARRRSDLGIVQSRHEGSQPIPRRECVGVDERGNLELIAQLFDRLGVSAQLQAARRAMLLKHRNFHVDAGVLLVAQNVLHEMPGRIAGAIDNDMQGVVRVVLPEKLMKPLPQVRIGPSQRQQDASPRERCVVNNRQDGRPKVERDESPIPPNGNRKTRDDKAPNRYYPHHPSNPVMPRCPINAAPR